MNRHVLVAVVLDVEVHVARFEVHALPREIEIFLVRFEAGVHVKFDYWYLFIVNEDKSAIDDVYCFFGLLFDRLLELAQSEALLRIGTGLRAVLLHPVFVEKFWIETERRDQQWA